MMTTQTTKPSERLLPGSDDTASPASILDEHHAQLLRLEAENRELKVEVQRLIRVGR